MVVSREKKNGTYYSYTTTSIVKMFATRTIWTFFFGVLFSCVSFFGRHAHSHANERDDLADTQTTNFKAPPIQLNEEKKRKIIEEPKKIPQNAELKSTQNTTEETIHFERMDTHTHTHVVVIVVTAKCRK